eukprot:Nk52_evm34s234 gene=Nk52_evmTU34s234
MDRDSGASLRWKSASMQGVGMLLLLLCVACCQAEESPLKHVVIEHNLGPQGGFQERFIIEPDVTQSMSKEKYAYFKGVSVNFYSPSEIETMKYLSEQGIPYIVRVRSDPNDRTSPFLHSFAEPEQLLYRRDKFVLHVSPSGRKFTSVNYIPFRYGTLEVSNHDNLEKLRIATDFVLDRGVEGPVPTTSGFDFTLPSGEKVTPKKKKKRTITNEKGEKQVVEEEVVEEEEKSFFQKYWMYIVPVVLMMMMSGGPEQPAAQGGSGGGGGGAARQ